MTVEQAIGILAVGFGAGAACFLAILRFLPKNPIFAKRGLVTESAIVGVPTADTAQAADKAAARLVGKTGRALSMLRPAGKMEADDGTLLDVVAEGELIEAGTRVKVLECRDGRIVVVRAEGS
jgi:membrane-bound serine protease (ClpP class)